MFSCKFCKISRNSRFVDYTLACASGLAESKATHTSIAKCSQTIFAVFKIFEKSEEIIDGGIFFLRTESTTADFQQVCSQVFFKDALDELIDLLTVDSSSMNDRELTLLQEKENKICE